MADRFLTIFLARLRFAAANLQVVPLLAFLFVVVAAFVQFFLLPGREAAIEESERRLASLERSARRAAIERQSERVSPEETRQRLLGRFPSEEQLNAELGRLLEMAASEGLQVSSGDYRMTPGKDGMFDRYVLNIPLKGNYQKIRTYLKAVRLEFPEMAIDDISLRRENIGSGDVEAQLRFILFGRRQAS
ncbi:MAG: hypothetical protein Q8S26_08925 [Azonexus sp.]|nr:hypothetical protein [Azonexus sp.]